jgi:serine/threonine protein kinase
MSAPASSVTGVKIREKPLGEGETGVFYACFIDQQYSPRGIKLPKNKVDMTTESAILERVRGLPHVLQLRNFVQEERLDGTEGRRLPIVDRIEASNLLSIAKRRMLSTNEFLLIFYQGLEALQGLEEREVVHCDIKPEHLFFEPESRSVTLIDFGLAAQPQEGTKFIDPHYRVGTPGYIAPEMALSIPCSYPVDLWSLGVTLYEIYTNRGERNLFSCEWQQIPQRIAYRYAQVLGLPSPECLEKYPIYRAAFSQSKKPDIFDWRGELRDYARVRRDSEEFAQELLRLFAQIFEYDPEKRITPKQALQSPLFRGIFTFSVKTGETNYVYAPHLRLFKETEPETKIFSVPLCQRANTCYHFLLPGINRLACRYQLDRREGPLTIPNQAILRLDRSGRASVESPQPEGKETEP